MQAGGFFTGNGRKTKEGAPLDIKDTLNELLVKLFRNINTIEEQAIRTEEYRDMTTNDMHVIEAIGTGAAKNMTSVAKNTGGYDGDSDDFGKQPGEKGYVERVRSEEDRRVVLISLTAKGKKAFAHHKKFHDDMIRNVLEGLSDEEQVVLQKSLGNLVGYFQGIQNGKK